MAEVVPQPVQLYEGETPVELHRLLVEVQEWHAAQAALMLGIGVAVLLFLVVLTVVFCYRGAR